MEFLRKIWIKIKQMLGNPWLQYPVAGLVAAYLTYRYMNLLPPEVKVSDFLTSLNSDQVKEIIDYGSTFAF
jgi:hypothetical protein